MVKDFTGKVKPCPMCGSKRIVSDYPTMDVFYSISMQCADCGLKGFKNFTKNVDIDEGYKRLIEYWNTRAKIDE